MLTRKDAIKLVKQNLNAKFDVIEDAIIEKPYGWLIFTQTKKYIQTKDWHYKNVGRGGTLVEKLTGRCIHFGSQYTTETHLKMYELGYLKHHNWDLELTQSQ